MIYKKILNSTLPLVITIILFIVVGNYGIGRVRSLQSQIFQARSDKAALTEKLGILQTSSVSVGSGSQAAALALPEKNSVLIALTQVKSLARENGAVLTNLKSGMGVKDPTGLSRVDLNFDVNGTRPAIIGFLKGVGNIAPVSLVDKITFSESMGVSVAAVTMKSFWAAFPENLPSITQTITDLTEDEKNTLAKISTFSQPLSLEGLVGTESGRSNPFLP